MQHCLIEGSSVTGRTPHEEIVESKGKDVLDQGDGGVMVTGTVDPAP
jgi:hypothetical protein